MLPDSSPLLVGSARSAALAGADTVLLLGARSYTVMVMKMAMCKMARGGVDDDDHKKDDTYIPNRILTSIMNRLNWMLHYGTAPRWKTGVKIIQVRMDLQTIRSDPINNYHHNLTNTPLLDFQDLGCASTGSSQYRINHSQVDLCAEELHNSIPATVAIQVKPLAIAPWHNVLNIDF